MLKIRPVSDNDCRLLWEWVNEPQVRAFAFNSEPVPWVEHLEWFKKKRSDPACSILILTDEKDVPVGQVRFDLKSDRTAEIAISIASEQRGNGYGTEAIRLACGYFRRQNPVAEVVAYIKPENGPSIRAFQKAGFSNHGKRVVQGQPAVWMSLESSHG